MTGEACESGLCVDGFCCNSSCTGQCEACDVPGSEGICSPVVGAPHGDRTPCASDGSICGGQCDGALRDGCVYPTSVCRSASCDASSHTATLEASCDGQGNCPALQTRPCAPYVCDAAGVRCAGDCTTSADCTDGHDCSAGVCVPTLAQGEACGGDDQCSTGHCVDGVCCDRACDGQCEACDIEGSVGTCSLVSSGQPLGGRPACAGRGTCQGQCDGTSVTCVYPGSDVTCGDAFCANGKEVHAATCDGQGACGSPTETDCGLYVCGVSECLTSCESDDDCVSGARCVGSSCVLDVGDGGADRDGGDGADAGDDAGVAPVPGGDADGGSELDPEVSTSSGCGCRTAGGTNPVERAAWLAFGLGAAVLWKRRRRFGEDRDAL